MTGAGPLRVSVLGATGRMGRTVIEQIAANDSFTLAAAWSRKGGSADFATDDLDAACSAADVAIDFTLPSATDEILRACRAAATPLVSGVTGLSPEQRRALDAAAADIPLLHEHNLSIGVHVLRAVVGRAAALLPDTFTGEIIDVHHAEKRDAPSGTAITLAATVADSLDGAGTPPPVHSLRGGSVVGEHSVHFFGPMERLTLTHRADDRAVFAVGALQAARWLRDQSAGRLWTVADWLNRAACG
ncbi:MAG: 4-hydroxy-tetrahydrodipicolinate reductase [Pseudomonadota bacterium]